jgi:hypothetical protein
MGKKTFEEDLNLTRLEKEVITLRAVLDMVNDMVNHETMIFHLTASDSSIVFKTMTHKAFFNIILVDLLSIPSEFFKKEGGNYIQRLKAICESPLMDNACNKENTQCLRAAVNAFAEWLSQTVIVEKRWFPSLNLELDLSIQREEFIKMCGNLCKHNFTQTTIQAKKLRRIFEENEQSIDLDKCLVALEDFQEQLDSVFLYHVSAIAEFLNNIRWGIHSYAAVERLRAVECWYDEEMNISKYKYRYPAEIASDLGKACYWGLMNDVTREPQVQRFAMSKYLKSRY